MCSGQLLSIQQNAALFSLLGTSFGGNGTTTFALPNLGGRVPIGQGNGNGLTPFVVGEQGGVESVTLTQSTTPSHLHSFNASTALGSTTTASGNVLATLSTNDGVFYAPAVGEFKATPMPPTSVSTFGGSQPHTNLQPTICINYSIALSGIFPSRN